MTEGNNVRRFASGMRPCLLNGKVSACGFDREAAGAAAEHIQVALALVGTFGMQLAAAGGAQNLRAVRSQRQPDRTAGGVDFGGRYVGKSRIHASAARCDPDRFRRDAFHAGKEP